MGPRRERRTRAARPRANRARWGEGCLERGSRPSCGTASDGNQDELTFDVFYRTDTQTAWSTLAEELRESIFTWDTSSAPDGTYVFRVVATDALSNPPGLAMRGAMASTPFDIDNSPPQIVLDTPRTQTGEAVVGFVVNDTHSPVERVGVFAGYRAVAGRLSC